MNRIQNQLIVTNVTDNDVTDFIKDLTILPPKGKENSEPLNSASSVLKRRKSLKVKSNTQQTNQNDALNKTTIGLTSDSTSQPTDSQSEFSSYLKETNHFDFASSTNSKTSNNKLEQSNRITYTEMIDVLNKYQYKHHDLIDNLNNQYENYFDKWLSQMKFGFNILLYGVGSKKSLIEKFVQLNLKNNYYVTLLGYHPDMNAKSLIKSILINVLGINETLKSFDEQINAIKTHLDFPLYLIIHNIDGCCLRDSDIQYRLSELATIDNIHIIASIDHINSALLWDHMQYIAFKWVYYDVSTFKCYNDEIMFENSLMLNQTENVQLSSLIHVLKSLTQNAKNIFLIMVEHALNAADKSKKCLAFTKLYYECREKFYVSNELTLRAQLTEFIDHKLIKLKNESDGSEMIYLLIDDVNLKLYLEELKDKV